MRLVHLGLAAIGAFCGFGAAQDSSFNATKEARKLVGIIAGHPNCDGCTSVMTELKAVAETGNKPFVATLIAVCDIASGEPPDVCSGLLREQGPILAEDLRGMTIGSHTMKLLCTNLLGLCPYQPIVPSHLKLPKPVKQRTRPTPSGQKPIEIVHISDTHVDLDYVTGSNADCDYPICCRVYDDSDAPGNNSSPCGKWGNTNCDPPLRLMRSMLTAINDNFPKAKFTVFTGDIPAHDVWLVNRREVSENLRVTYNHFETLNRKVFPAVGNHDTSPVNAFPPSQLSNYNAENPQWSYNIFSQYWAKWIGASAARESKDYGSYSSLTKDGKLRVISFNSILYYILDFWNYIDPMPTDPSGQFAWLVSELQAAETAGERVWLIAHVPSGSSDFFQDYSHTFNSIIERYEGTISACFYGHTHTDSFEVAYSNYASDYTAREAQDAIMASYIVPSMTPTSGSPSFRVYMVDPVTYAVLDYEQWNASPDWATKPKWEKYYSAKAAYGSLLSPPVTDVHSEMTPAFWHNVTEAFVTHDGQFQNYYKRKTRGLDPNLCGKICKAAELCQLRAANSEFNCVTPKPGINFGKRELESLDECGENILRRMFMKISRGAHEIVHGVRLED